MPEYRLTSDLPYPRNPVFDWHLRSGALERLTPPWADMTVLEREGGPANRGRVLLQVRRGPLSVKWAVAHNRLRVRPPLPGRAAVRPLLGLEAFPPFRRHRRRGDALHR